MNGDDGYVEAGGGGSVWWKVRVSEGGQFDTRIETPNGDPAHKPDARRPGTAAYVLTGRDSYGKPDGDATPEYFVVTIPDAKTITRIEVEGSELRLYLPVIRQERPQVQVRWGLRVVRNLFQIDQLRALLGTSTGAPF